jgi:two-component system, NarL family, nitrate/nitrite response regulator NarL
MEFAVRVSTDSMSVFYPVSARLMILIASSKPHLCRRWRRALQGVYPASAVSVVTTRMELERHLAGMKPLVVIVDLELPGLGSIKHVWSIQGLSLQMKVVVLTDKPNEREGLAALRAGLKGYDSKNITSTLLRKSVKVIQKGEIWVRRGLLSQFVEETIHASESGRRTGHLPGGESRFGNLTRREREIVYLIRDGGTNKEIANRLKVSEKTVKAHLTSIFRKLKVSDRLRLALLAVQHPRVSPILLSDQLN